MTPAQIKQTLQKIQAAPLKQLGQNFLIDEKILANIVKFSYLTNCDKVVEIGPGLGVLTKKLLKKAPKVLCVEKDPKFFGFLQEKFKKEIDSGKLILINADILNLNLPQTLARFFDFNLNLNHQNFKDQPQNNPKSKENNYKIVANIPYNITSPLLHLFLETPFKASQLTLLVQKEVAERICAQPPHLNPLALKVQSICQPQIKALVPSSSFYPEPAVASAILNLEKLNPDFDFKAPQTKQLFQLIKTGFASPRKKLLNNLLNWNLAESAQASFSKKNQTAEKNSEKQKKLLLRNKLLAAFSELKLNENSRAEALSLKHWQALLKILAT